MSKGGFNEPSELLMLGAIVAIAVVVLELFGQPLVAAIVVGAAVLYVLVVLIVNRLRKP